jgi:hypothetical protein
VICLLVVVAGVSSLQPSLNRLQLTHLVVGDVRRRPRRELAADVRLHVGDVSDVASGHRHDHESSVQLLVEQTLGAQLEQRLAHRGDADTQLGRQLVEPHILARGVRPVEDPVADVPRHGLGKLWAGGEFRNRHGQIR